MDPNTPRLEAERWLGIAVKLLTARDFLGSKTFAIRARESDPSNDISDRILAVVDTVLAGEKRVNPSQHPDWYTVLQLPRLVRDPELIANHYRRLVVLLSPERNRFPFSDYALQLVMDAWSILSDPSKKWLFDNELAVYLNRVEQERLGSSGVGPQQPQQQQVQAPAADMSAEVAVAAAAGTFQFLMPNVPQQQQQPQPTVSVPLWPPQQQQQQQHVEQEQHQQQHRHYNSNNNAININSNAININSDNSRNHSQNQNQLHQIEFMQAQPHQQMHQQQQQQQQAQQQQQFPPQWQMRDPVPTRRVTDVVSPVVRRVSEMVVPTQPVATMAGTRVFDGNFGNVVGRGGNVNMNVNVAASTRVFDGNAAAPTRVFDGNAAVPPANMTRVYDGHSSAPPPGMTRVFDGNVDVPPPGATRVFDGNVVNDNVMYNVNENNSFSADAAKENDNGIRNNNNNDDDINNVVNDNKNNVEALEDVEGSFWTSCPYCLYIYEYPKVYQECSLRCQNCRRGFHAVVVPNPPPISGVTDGDGDGGDEKDVKTSFNSWGFFPIGFSTAKWKKNNRMGKAEVASDWVPFSPMFECPAENGGESFQWFENSEGAAVGPKNTGKLPISRARIYRIIDEDGFNSDPSDSDSSDQDWRKNGYEKQKKKKRRVHFPKKVSPQPTATQNQTPRKSVTRTGASPGRPRLGTGYVTTNDIVIGLTASTNKADTRKKLAATLTRNQAKRRVKNMGKLDLNVEFNNEGNEHAPTMSAVNGEEDAIENIGFFEGLDEFFSTMPILNVGEEEKAKPS